MKEQEERITNKGILWKNVRHTADCSIFMFLFLTSVPLETPWSTIIRAYLQCKLRDREWENSYDKWKIACNLLYLMETTRL